jgi:hypothetical protein
VNFIEALAFLERAFSNPARNESNNILKSLFLHFISLTPAGTENTQDPQSRFHYVFGYAVNGKPFD